MKATIRRLENNLITLGTGSIAFGFWTFLKFAVSNMLLGIKYAENISETAKLITVIISWTLPSVDLMLRFLVGISAREEGRGKKKSAAYLVAAFFILIYSMPIIFIEVYLIITAAGKLTYLISLFIDVTALVFIVEIIASSIKLRRLKKLPAHKEGAAV